MELIRNYSYYVIWNKVFVFIVLSCILHAGFFSLFYFYNGNIKDSYAEESMMVRIVGTLVPDNVIRKKRVSRGISNHSRSKIISGLHVTPASEKNLLSPVPAIENQRDKNVPPIPNYDTYQDRRGFPTPPESVHNTAEGPPPVISVSESSASGSKTGTENSDVDGLSTGDSSGGDNINGASIALSGSEASLQIQKELRDIVLTNIRKNMIYPMSARKLGLEGDVNISFRIAPDGTVNNVSASSKKNDLSVLEKAAVSLIYKSAPYYLSGPKKMGEAVSIQMVISYRLEDEKR